MLARAQRMRDGDAFRVTVRRGRKAAARTLVVHVLTTLEAPAPDAPSTVGLVVAKSVGDAVTRNRVKRRLRHLMRARLDALGSGTRVVVRALPPAASATSAELGADLDHALRRGARMRSSLGSGGSAEHPPTATTASS